jgi:16S rRNA (guanine1207-N2)-methyltransferase
MPSRPPAFDCADRDYLRWRTLHVVAGGRRLAIHTKPGAPFDGGLDPSAALLLGHLDVRPGERVVDLRAGAGVVACHAALSAPGVRLRLSDPHLLAVRAARRTLDANGVEGAEVEHEESGTVDEGTADVALLRIPQPKLPTLERIWAAYRALRPGGRCFVAGPNDEGVRPALRALATLFGAVELLGYRGGHRLAVAVRPDRPAVAAGEFDLPWLDRDRFHRYVAEAPDGPLEVRSRPGVFSWDRLDRGTAALLDALRIGEARRILDLGCGAGVIGVAAARSAPDALVTLLDVDAGAVRSARRTAAANGVADRCEVRAADGATEEPDGCYDLVLANPPFHVGKATSLEVPAQFIRDAARVLAPGGTLLLVANRTLPYEAWLRACFGGFDAVTDGREFKVLRARKNRSG